MSLDQWKGTVNYLIYTVERVISAPFCGLNNIHCIFFAVARFNREQVCGEIEDCVKTGIWVGDCFIYTNAVNRLNYYVGGEIVTIAHLDRFVR